jgi:hypothetical protein
MIAVHEVLHLAESSVKNQATTSIEEAKYLYHGSIEPFSGRVYGQIFGKARITWQMQNLMVVIEQAGAAIFRAMKTNTLRVEGGACLQG